MSEREKEKRIQNQLILQEEELEQVTGGGQYYPVNGCPYGHTKIVHNLWGDSRHAECNKGCEHYYSYKTSTPGGNRPESGCKLTGDLAWEW